MTILLSVVVVHGVTDCGCFGSIPISSTPTMVYIRNTSLLLLLVPVAVYGEQENRIMPWKCITMGTVFLASAFVAGMTYRPTAFTQRHHPLEGRKVNGTPLEAYTTRQYPSELVMFFSYSCPHCVNSMENFKAWEHTNTVSHISAYVVVESNNPQSDSLRHLFQQRFPTITAREVNKEDLPFVNAFPTFFIIQSDSIKKVIIGELPSPYTVSN